MSAKGSDDDIEDMDKGSVGAPPFATYGKTSGNKVRLYGLASEGDTGTSGAFHDLAQAIDDAQQFIFIADWSFQPYVRLRPRLGVPIISDTAGALLNAAAERGALVAVNAWEHFSVFGIGAPDPQNNNGGKHLDTIGRAMTMNARRSVNFLWRTTKRKSHNFSIHQKFVVLDAVEPGFDRRVVKAFFGGLDITKGRFDWAEHRILPPRSKGDEPFVAAVTSQFDTFDDWYNAEFEDAHDMPREPWNDFYGYVVGPSAWDVAREFVGRWHKTDNGSSGDDRDGDKQRVTRAFVALFDKSKLVQEWEPHNGPFIARVVRSIERNEWGEQIVRHHVSKDEIREVKTNTEHSTQRELQWRLGEAAFEQSIQTSYLNAIKTADRFVYIETQYFIGSGSSWVTPRPSVKNEVPRAITDKILDKIKHDQPFHAYIVMPMFPEGDPMSTGAIPQRNFEHHTMRFMAQEVFKAAHAKGKDWRDYLSFHFLVNWNNVSPKLDGDRRDRVKANQRYMVYVHSKLLIADDQLVILGSANLNERSLAGDRDTEICLALSPDNGKLVECREVIRTLRHNAWLRHLGGKLPPDADAPEKATCARAFQGAGTANWKALASGVRGDSSHLVTFPFVATESTFAVDPQTATATLRNQELYLLDAAAHFLLPNDLGTMTEIKWRWQPPDGSWEFAAAGDLAE